MTRAELTEAVARAIRETLRASGSCVRGDVCGDASCVCCLEASRAAIAAVAQAMREPMPEMVAAWYRVKNGHHFHDEPPPTDTSDYAAYRAMFAASPLAEDKP